MLNLDYPYKYVPHGNLQIRVYQIPCTDCGKLRWKRASQRNQPICASCSATIRIKAKYLQKYECIQPKCKNLITKPFYFCRRHVKLNFHRYKEEAKWAVHNAVASGRLKRLPCIKCGEIKSEGHHPDHRNKLDVLWLCRSHHMEIHGGRFN